MTCNLADATTSQEAILLVREALQSWHDDCHQSLDSDGFLYRVWPCGYCRVCEALAALDSLLNPSSAVPTRPEGGPPDAS